VQGGLRASFFRVMLFLTFSTVAADVFFFRRAGETLLGGVLVGQAVLLAACAFFGYRNLPLVRAPEAGEPYAKFVLPNVLTLIRILAIPGVVGGILLASTDPVARVGVAILFGVATLSDLVDGWIGRKFDRTSLFGQVLDPLGDAMFYTSVTIAFWVVGVLPPWLGAIVIARFVPSMIAGVFLFVRHGPSHIAPTRMAKNSSFVVGLATATVLARLVIGPPVPALAVTVVGGLAALLSVASLVEYGSIAIRRLSGR